MKKTLTLLLLAIIAICIPVAVFAEVAPVAANVSSQASPAAASPDYVLWLTTAIAALTSLIAIWQTKEKTTAKKVSETLVVAIEAASKIPEVAAQEQKLKAKIKEVTTNAGVEPVVNKLVDLLT